MHAQAADCTLGRVAPPTFFLQPSTRILFFGDSITHAAARTPYAYPDLVRHILHNTYCDLATVEIEAWGRSGSSYRRYPRALQRTLRRSADQGYDWVMFQDAGRALEAANGRFESAVRATIAATHQSMPGAQILLATTPPLDDVRARQGYRRRYAKSDNFRMNNAVVESFDGYEDATHVIPWAADSCASYSGHPEVAWTRDGVHPTPAGHLLLALSILRSLGADRADLDLIGLEALHSSLDAQLAAAVADWVYGAAGACVE